MNEQSIFLAALDIADSIERAAYVQSACADDPALGRRVSALLSAHERSGEFLDVPAVEQIAASEPRTVDGTLAFDPAGKQNRSDDRSNTQADSKDDKGEDVLECLQPSTRPGSLGRLGHYEVLEVLGQGGFGTVVKAFDEKLHRMVAIKIMSLELAATSPARKRFLREARSSAAVRHENVVSIYAVEDKPVPHLVMEFIDGETLQQRLDRVGPLDTRDVLRIGQQIASGLAAAHAMGLIHRDIKPANILLENGIDRVKITDFGLARAADDASLTQSGVIAGTPLYMSPEQAQGDPIDQRSDLFSFGSVLYVMCSGRPPFRAPTTLKVLKRVAEDQPRPIQEIIPEVPAWLSAPIARLHAKKPGDRFASAQEVADHLGRCLSELQLRGNVQAPVPVPVPPTAPKQVPRTRRPMVAAAIVALFIGLLFSEATRTTNVFQGTVNSLLSSEGTLVVEMDDPKMSVDIHHNGKIAFTIIEPGIKELRVKAGQYKVQARKDGKVVRQELVTVMKNGRAVVRISEVVEPKAPIRADATEWEKTVAAMAAEKQVDAVKARLKELNPGFDGKVKHEVEDGVVTELRIVTDRVTDISPIRVFNGLRALDCSGTHVNWTRSNGQLADLTPLKGMNLANLTLLRLNYTKVQDAGLAHFEDCKDLTTLGLDGTKVSDSGLAHFTDCKNLTQLYLASTQVNDVGLAHFKDSKNLTHLGLGGTKVSDAGLAHFADCKNLVHLDLGGTKVSDAGLAHFADCKNLTYLALGYTKVSDAGLEHFKDCKKLTNLLLDGTNVTDAGLTNFEDCKDLTLLWLNSTQVGDAGLAHFKHCKNLKRLNLEGTKVGDEGLAHFEDCKNLTHLNLQGTQVSDTGLAHFKDCRDLTFLDLRKTKVTAAKIEALKKALPKCKIEWDGGVIVPK